MRIIMVKITNIIDFKKKFANKIGDYRRRDKVLLEKYPELNENSKTLLLSEGIRMIDELETDICVECNCNILFQEYNMWCFYQFSFDRIDNKKIHSIDNLRIICWGCNSYANEPKRCKYCFH